MLQLLNYAIPALILYQSYMYTLIQAQNIEFDNDMMNPKEFQNKITTIKTQIEKENMENQKDEKNILLLILISIKRLPIWQLLVPKISNFDYMLQIFFSIFMFCIMLASYNINYTNHLRNTIFLILATIGNYVFIYQNKDKNESLLIVSILNFVCMLVFSKDYRYVFLMLTGISFILLLDRQFLDYTIIKFVFQKDSFSQLYDEKDRLYDEGKNLFLSDVIHLSISMLILVIIIYLNYELTNVLKEIVRQKNSNPFDQTRTKSSASDINIHDTEQSKSTQRGNIAINFLGILFEAANEAAKNAFVTN